MKQKLYFELLLTGATIKKVAPNLTRTKFLIF